MTQVNTKVKVLKKKMLGNKQMDDQFHKTIADTVVTKIPLLLVH